MKKTLLLVLILLSSCQTKQHISDEEFFQVSRASWNAFNFNEQCPHLCWLGIAPDITTTEEAKKILKASKEIDPEWYSRADVDLFTYWYPARSKAFPSGVTVGFRDGLVESLSIMNVPNTIGDFIKELGEPDHIRISVHEASDAEYVPYAVYFSSRKVMMSAISSTWLGPQPSDPVHILQLNTEFVDIFHWGRIQPWLGFGHLTDYLPGVEIPTDDTP
jgi:hypothetical protein